MGKNLFYWHFKEGQDTKLHVFRLGYTRRALTHLDRIQRPSHIKLRHTRAKSHWLGHTNSSNLHDLKIGIISPKRRKCYKYVVHLKLDLNTTYITSPNSRPYTINDKKYISLSTQKYSPLHESLGRSSYQAFTRESMTYLNKPFKIPTFTKGL